MVRHEWDVFPGDDASCLVEEAAHGKVIDRAVNKIAFGIGDTGTGD